MPRWHVACDNCAAEAWIGRGDGGVDAWCEACQQATRLAHDAADDAARCPHCGTAPLSTHGLSFEELYGRLQDVVVVLGAWNGDAAPLEALLPDRPRFLTDLNPPAVHPHDDTATIEALEHLRRGDFTGARQRLEALLPEGGGSARLWRALGIAAERLEEPALAEAAYGRALEKKDSPRVRLARGALRARRGDFAAAHADLERAGSDYEARWNRAALTVLEAVALTTGLPPQDALGRARAEIPAPSSYWAEPTVGRLLWSLLIERLQSRAGRELSTCPDERALRAAENELEFDTFWDRALVVNAYAAAEMRADLERTASALALDLLTALATEPALAGPAARAIADGVREIAARVRERQPAEALAAARALLERDDLRRYRIPCARCTVGRVGVDQVLEELRRATRPRGGAARGTHLLPVALATLALALPGCQRRETSATPEVRIQVTRDGFEPASVTAPAGPVTLVVTRRTDETCATDMVFTSLDRKVDLPLYKAVRIPVTLAPGETLHYACGMDMYKGQVVAR